jgi:protein arginine kinase activator
MELLKCSICGNPAVVRIEQVVQNMKQSVNLCESCARNYGVLTKDMMPFSVIKPIGAALFGDLNLSMADPDCCHRCGYTVELFQKTGNLGCSRCYEYFGKQLSPLIERMQKNLQHIGKRPRHFSMPVEENSTKESLRKKLQLAIEREDFEEAAKIRDQLRSP